MTICSVNSRLLSIVIVEIVPIVIGIYGYTSAYSVAQTVSLTITGPYQNLSLLPTMDLAKAKELVGFIWYLVHDGQSLGSSMGYVPLPPNVVAIDEAGIRSVVFQGQSLI